MSPVDSVVELRSQLWLHLRRVGITRVRSVVGETRSPLDEAREYLVAHADPELQTAHDALAAAAWRVVVQLIQSVNGFGRLLNGFLKRRTMRRKARLHYKPSAPDLWVAAAIERKLDHSEPTLPLVHEDGRRWHTDLGSYHDLRGEVLLALYHEVLSYRGTPERLCATVRADVRRAVELYCSRSEAAMALGGRDQAQQMGCSNQIRRQERARLEAEAAERYPYGLQLGLGQTCSDEYVDRLRAAYVDERLVGAVLARMAADTAARSSVSADTPVKSSGDTSPDDEDVSGGTLVERVPQPDSAGCEPDVALGLDLRRAVDAMKLEAAWRTPVRCLLDLTYTPATPATIAAQLTREGVGGRVWTTARVKAAVEAALAEIERRMDS